MEDPTEAETLCGLSAFEKAYGANPLAETVSEDPLTGNFVLSPTSARDRVEIDRKRVAKALGTEVPMAITPSKERMELRDKRVALVDLSGTLHVEDQPTPGAVTALAKLRCAGFRVLFVTNTTKESKGKLFGRLVDMGFDIGANELFTSMDATRAYVEEKGLRPMLLIADEAQEDFVGIDTSDPNCVVIGLSSKHFNRDTLSEALRLVTDKDAELIAVHKGRMYRSSTGLNMGPGPFAVALEVATQKTAVCLGKPERNFYEAALSHIGCEDASQAVMIGDDIRDDVLGAMRIGITGILVKTGKWTPADASKVAPNTPDYTVDNFSTAVQLLIDAKR